jgi:L-ascorbate metabolism protein UlaG (beta-lactamase superfamily)
VAFLPIGAYKPQWFMAPYHMSPEEAVRAHNDLGVESSIAIHFGTFALADDGQTEPVDELQRVLQSCGEPKPQFCALSPGESKRFVPQLTNS